MGKQLNLPAAFGLALLGLVLSGPLAPASAATVKVVAADGQGLDSFGVAVDTDDERMIVGAPGPVTLDLAGGAAYVYRLEQGVWVEEARLTSPNPTVFDLYGYSVQIEDRRAVVGAWGEAAFRGAVYVYERQETAPVVWQLVETLTPEVPAVNRAFGFALSLDGDVLAIGAPGEVIGDDDNGVAYLFARTAEGWSQAAKLETGEDLFLQYGFSVALDGNRLAVGAPFDGPTGDGGRAYLYRRQGAVWTPEAILTGSGADFGDAFGVAVDLVGDLAVVGASDYGGLSAGAAFTFRFNQLVGWQAEALLEPPGLSAGAGMGFALESVLTPAGEFIAVGAPADGDGFAHPGSIYLFRNLGSGWDPLANLTAPDGKDGDGYGSSLSLLADRVQVSAGAPFADGVRSRTGAVYVTTP